MMWHNLPKELQRVKSQILRNDHLESKIKEKDINLAVVFSPNDENDKNCFYPLIQL